MSKRKYKIVVLDGDEMEVFTHSIYVLMDHINPGDWELIYAIREIIDKVLDLKEGESIYFQPIRDQQESKGIIYRLKN